MVVIEFLVLGVVKTTHYFLFKYSRSYRSNYKYKTLSIKGLEYNIKNLGLEVC